MILTLRSCSVSDSSILPEELATQSVRLKEEQLRKEEEKVTCFILIWILFQSAYSYARSSSKYNVRLTRRGKSCLPRKSPLGMLFQQEMGHPLKMINHDAQESRESACCPGVTGRILSKPLAISSCKIALESHFPRYAYPSLPFL